MSDQPDYIQAAHELSRGRDHRTQDQPVPEELHPVTQAPGAWVPIMVWIPRTEAEQILERAKDRT